MHRLIPGRSGPVARSVLLALCHQMHRSLPARSDPVDQLVLLDLLMRHRWHRWRPDLLDLVDQLVLLDRLRFLRLIPVILLVQPDHLDRSDRLC